MKAYSQDLRDRAILMFDNGYSRLDISSILSVHYETIKEWIRRYLITGDYSSRQHLNQGVACKFSDKEKVLSYLSDNPDANAIMIRDAVAPDINMNTFRDSLKRMGIKNKKRTKV